MHGAGAGHVAGALGAWLLAFLVIGFLGFSQGGYFPSAWGWPTLLLLWVAGTALVLRPGTRPSALEAATLLGLGGLLVLTLVSARWSLAPGQAVLEAQRLVLYVGGVTAVLFALRRRHVPYALGGLLSALVLVCGYGLATRLFPTHIGVFDPLAVYRLAEPVGYWNALAIIAAMAIVLAVGLVAFGERAATRLAAAGAVPILVTALYFTFGRAAWAALGLALVAASALTPRRLRLATALVVLAPPAAVAVWLAAGSEGLTVRGAPVEEAAADGRRLALWLGVLVLGSMLLSAAVLVGERTITVPRRVRLAYGTVLLVLVAAVAVAGVARAGGPAELVERAAGEFRAPPPSVDGDQSERLFSFSGNRRTEHWGVAWDGYRSSPLRGVGAGSYQRLWFRDRPEEVHVRDAHSLYVETLAELGPAGLLLLVAILAPPLAVAVRARRLPLTAPLLGAYLAFLLHAGLDWDWEVPAVTLTALVCGSCLLLLGRTGESAEREWPLRLPTLGVVAALAAFAFVGLMGVGALAESERAREAGDLESAAVEAQRAAQWMPWSARPLAAAGEAHLAAGRIAAAREAFVEAAAKDPEDWRLWYEVARTSEGEERDHALARAAALNPLSPEVVRLRQSAAGGDG